MSVDIDAIKRKLLIKYPTFGSTIARLELQPNEQIGTAGTDGKKLLYNPKFVESLSESEQVFLFAHEVCHVAFEHIYRSEGKDKRLWNIATDSVINALLQKDGLSMIKGGVDIPDAVNHDAEEMYNMLLEQQKEKQSQKNGQSGQNDMQETSGGQGLDGEQDQQNENESSNVGHDDHNLWDEAIKEAKKEQNERKCKEEANGKSKKNEEKENKGERNANEKSPFVEQGEKETFKQNKEERKRKLQELSKELAKESSHTAGTDIQREGRKLSDIGIAAPLIDWRKLLRQSVTHNEEWTRKNARMRDGYFKHRLEQIPIPETEILLDTSGSVSETLLKNFLRECKNILNNSRVKVGCFNTEFHGFTELKRPEDIDNMDFPIGGGTDFSAAVEAFSRSATNKIIFTDGYAPMPSKPVRNMIWVVFGDNKIKPKTGRVINITGDKLDKLSQKYTKDNENER